MSLDPKVKEAIRLACAQEGQGTGLSRKLVAWLDAVTSGNEDMADVDVTDRRLEVILADVAVDASGEGDESGSDGEDEE